MLVDREQDKMTEVRPGFVSDRRHNSSIIILSCRQTGCEALNINIKIISSERLKSLQCRQTVWVQFWQINVYYCYETPDPDSTAAMEWDKGERSSGRTIQWNQLKFWNWTSLSWSDKAKSLTRQWGKLWLCLPTINKLNSRLKKNVLFHVVWYDVMLCDVMALFLTGLTTALHCSGLSFYCLAVLTWCSPWSSLVLVVNWGGWL